MSEALDRYIEEDRRSRGRLPPEDKGFFGGIKKGFLNASVGALGGIGKTVETFSSEDSTDAYGNKFGSGLRKWAEETLHSNQQWRPAENGGWGEYAGNAIGNAIGSTAVLAPAVAADAMLGTRGAATFALCFGQTFGDNLQRNRELYGVENESKNLGLAAAESAVDSFIEVALGTVPMLGKTLKGLSYAGKREIVRNMFREAEKDLGKSGAKKFFLGMAKNGAEEGAEEGLQYVNSWMWRALGGDQSNEFKLDELADNMAQGAIGGAALGIIGGADSARNARRALETEKTEQQTNPPETPVAVTTRFGEIPLGADGKPLQPVDADSQALLDKHLENPQQQEELSESGIPKRIIDTSAQLTRMIADDLGIKLRYFDEEGVDPHVGKDYVQNGWFDKETNELWIDRRGTGRNPLQNMGHEFKHYLNKTTPELAQKFDALFQSGMTQEGRNELEKIGELYRNDKQRNPDANAAEEFSADTFAQFWTEPDFWRNVAEKAESQERGMGEKLLAALQDFIKMVRKKLKQIGTPEAKALFDNMGELRNEAVRIVAEVRRRNGQSSEAENVVGVNGKNTVQSVPVRDLNLDPQRFQFKSKADKVTGVDESNKIGGTWDPKSAGNLYIWEDKNGKKFIVNGHHRFDLARKNNVENVNAIIDREADGVTAEQARRNGVLINIRDEQGDVRDYAEFVRRENMDENTAEKEGILSRAKGRQGYTIGRYAGNTLYSAYRNRDISDQAAALIADIARGDEAIEAVGIREKNLKPEELRQLLKALNEMERPKTTQGDLFGFDDSALEVEKTLSKLAAKHIREIRETVNAARDAIKNPEAARKLGVKVGKDAERLLNNALKEQAEWDKWYLAGSGKREILMKEAGISNRTDTPELKKKELTPPEKRTADDSMSDENTDSPLHRKDSRTSGKDAGTRKTTQEDNIYLRMPMDRVRNDAELGVKLAQDALKILEKQNPVSYSKPKAEKENTNDSNTSGNLEHRGNVGNSENTNHETALLNERGGNRRIPQSGIPETAESGLQRNGSGNLPGVPTANTRTGNREENHRGIPGNRTGAADDSGRKRSSDDSGTGTPLGTDGRRTEHNPARSEKTDRLTGRTSGTVKLRDRTNIAETLPYLFPEQQDDVFKAETRFEKNKGMLFTNATGTGKTFTGLGIIKRFVMQGKDNVLIVTPTDQKNKDWRNDAQKLDLDVKILSNTRDNGKNGIVVTTYANFQQNPELANRNWDLLVFDESHKISQSESGRNTQAANKLHYLSGAHGNAWERSIQENGVAIRDALAKIDPKYATYELKYDPEYTRNHPGKSHPPVLSKYDVDSHFKELPETLKNLLKKREEELSKSKVLFLSATPFAYHRSLLYADGYLFDIPKKDASGYNSANGEEEFFIRNFGYRMRYNKLTRPEASVDQGVMERAGTAENLGMGDAARNLRESLKEGYSNADYLEPGQNQGTGGKEADRNFDVMDDFSKAKTYYFGRGKKSAKNKAAEGTDYYATPEPLGLKMVEWADLRPNEDVLEPSAGHGAIARFFPDYVNSKAIEPSVILNSELAVNSSAQVLRERFEDHHIVNKYDGIVMNPPFGTGGKTAIEHLEKAFQHLRGLGRIVAILPEGGMAEKRLEAFLENTRGAHLTADIGLPNCTFQRAGTSVKTHIVVIDKAEYPYQENMMPEERGRIEISADNINEFFNKIKDLEIPSRRKETGKQYSLQRVPKNIADFRAMPAHPIPKKAKFSTVKELYEIYKKEYLGKVIRTASGHDITFKPGHFFRLIAGTPAEGRKGFIAKAKNAADAIAQIEDGKIGFGDIAGYQKMRGEYLGAFKDVITDADFWIREKENKFLFGKKYSDIKKADGFLAVTLEIEKEGKLGPVSFHPRKFSEGLFSGKEVHWNIANPLDHAKAPGDVSSRDKSSGLNDIIAPENKMSNGKLYSLSFPQQKNPIRENGNEKIRYQNQLDNRTYHTKSNEQLNKEAVERIANYGGIKNTIQMMMEGDLNFKSDVAQRVLQTVLNSDEFKALNNNEKEQIADVYIKTGTELGRALASRRLALLDMNDIHSMQAHVNALVAKLQKEKNLREIRNTIQKEFGIDIDNLPDSLVNNPQEFDRLLRRLASMKASKGDKLYEFWINSILSGPVTHTANILGNTANAVYELGVKRFTEALLNSVLHKKDAATFGEFREMTKAFNWKNAWEKAKTAFDLEVVTPDGKLESFRAAIGGNTGRIIRTPGRLLRAADEFAKAIIVPAEAAAHAYREGKAMNLPEADLKKYVSEQLKNLNSPSMEYGYQRALDLTFQEEPGVAIQTLMHWRDAGGIFGNVLKFTLPFLKTPGNILRQGIRKSPLGILNLAYQTGKAALGKRKIDNEYIQHAAEQILAWGTIAMIAGMDDDNDDGMPFLTGSSPAYGSAEQRFKANKVPPYSIRIGGTYYSYKRIEPLATGLAFIADGLDAYRKAKSGKEGTDVLKQMIRGVKQMIVEKSFLDSLGEINRIASDPERSGMTFLSNFASSWMPNVVRQTVGLFDDNVKDYKSRERGTEFFQDQFRVTTDRMFPWKAAPKIDYFGREIKKDSLEEAGPLGFLARLIPLQPISPDSSMNRAERLMWEYNQRHPENEFWPSVPAYYFSRDGKKGYFTGNDYQEFARESGQLALKQINNAFRHGLLNDKNPTERDIKLIRKIFSRARKEIREKMIRKGSFKTE